MIRESCFTLLTKHRATPTLRHVLHRLTETKDWLSRLELTKAADKVRRHQDWTTQIRSSLRIRTFDLSDDHSSIVVQVTVTTTAEKIRNTIQNFVERHSDKCRRLIIVYSSIVVPASRADFSEALQGFDFDPKRDRLGLGTISIEKLERFIDLLKKEPHR